MKLRLVVALCVLSLAGCGGSSSGKPRVWFMPKLTGIPYFNACKKGAEEAAKELNLELTYNGPTRADATEQVNLLDQWIAGSPIDMLCVACNDPDAVAPSLRRARDKRIFVITFDADTKEDARDFFVNMVTYDSIAEMMVDVMAEELSPKGEGKVGIVTSSVQAPNQSQWARRIKAYAARKYPKMELLPETEHGEDRALGVTKAKALIQATPDLKGIIGLTSVAVPAAAEAVRQEGKKGQIKVTGVSTPRDMRDFVLDDTVTTFLLWNPVDLGYLAVHVADLLRRGAMPENGTINPGRLRDIKVRDREVLLGDPIKFTKENIDRYDF
jgi:ABC-type sugar transport system substrate-binding protein